MKRYLAQILLGITIMAVIVYFIVPEVDLKEYQSTEITIPNGSLVSFENNLPLAYLKKDMTLVTGVVTSKYDNGQLANQFTFINGVRDGLFKVWYKKNGQLSGEGIFKNGKIIGKLKTYFQNGQIKSEQNFTDDGKKSGSQKYWFENGQLRGQFQCVEDLQDGVSKLWYENGQLKLEDNYTNGIQNGISRFWHPNGQLAMERIYRNGVVEETISMFSEEGIDLQDTITPLNAFLIIGEWIFVDQEGDSGKVSFNNGIYKSYKSNGILEETGRYRINGEQLSLTIDNGPQVIMIIDTINSESLEMSLISDENHKIKGTKITN